jgi:hypothetical protein
LQLKGVGTKTAARLAETFGTLDEVRDAAGTRPARSLGVDAGGPPGGRTPGTASYCVLLRRTCGPRPLCSIADPHDHANTRPR